MSLCCGLLPTNSTIDHLCKPNASLLRCYSALPAMFDHLLPHFLMSSQNITGGVAAARFRLVSSTCPPTVTRSQHITGGVAVLRCRPARASSAGQCLVLGEPAGCAAAGGAHGAVLQGAVEAAAALRYLLVSGLAWEVLQHLVRSWRPLAPPAALGCGSLCCECKRCPAGVPCCLKPLGVQ